MRVRKITRDAKLREMKTDSTTVLDGNSRLLLRERGLYEGAPEYDVECTWAEVQAAAADWGMTPEDVEVIRQKLVAGRKAVFGGGSVPVHTLFWTAKGIPTGGEPLAVEKLEAEKLMRAAAPELLEVCEILVARWESDIVPPAEKLSGCVAMLRSAIAKAKGEAPKPAKLDDGAKVAVEDERTGAIKWTTWGQWKADLDGGAALVPEDVAPIEQDLLSRGESAFMDKVEGDGILWRMRLVSGGAR